MMMAVSLTLLPAFLAICGRRVNETSRAALIAVTVFIIGSIVGVVTAEPGTVPRRARCWRSSSTA